MTAQAAHDTEDLLPPSAAAAEVRRKPAGTRKTLIAKLTGRRPVTPAETQLIQPAGIQ
jgi:hypothetical protein